VDLLHDISATIDPEMRERIAGAIEQRIQILDGVDAIAAVAGASRFAERIDALIPNSATFQELLLNAKAVFAWRVMRNR